MKWNIACLNVVCFITKISGAYNERWLIAINSPSAHAIYSKFDLLHAYCWNVFFCILKFTFFIAELKRQKSTRTNLHMHKSNKEKAFQPIEPSQLVCIYICIENVERVSYFIMKTCICIYCFQSAFTKAFNWNAWSNWRLLNAAQNRHFCENIVTIRGVITVHIYAYTCTLPLLVMYCAVSSIEIERYIRGT